MSTLAIVYDTYPNIGGEPKNFALGDGTTTVSTSSSRQISTPKYVPLVEDLDGDGSIEIIVIDGSTLKVFNETSLSAVDTVDMDSSTAFISNLEIADINFDGKKEIYYYAHNDEKIHRIDYDNFSLSHTDLFSLSGHVHTYDSSMLGCNDNGRCLVVLADGTYFNNYLHIWGFNYTAGSGKVALEEYTSPHHGVCLPSIKRVETADYDNDGGDDEFIFSWLRPSQSTNARLYVEYISVPFTLTPSEEHGDYEDLGNIYDDSQVNCLSDGYVYALSPTTTYDFDDAKAGLETAVAVRTSSTEFKIFTFGSDGDFIDDYPEIDGVTAYRFSNVVVANVFDDTGRVDFCAMGWNSSGKDPVLLCGSELTGQFFEHETFLFYDDTVAISPSTTRYEHILHSVEYDPSNPYDEFLWSDGIYNIDYTGINEIEKFWSNPKAPSTNIQVDYEDTEVYEDKLFLSRTNLWYLDDGWANSGCLDSACIYSVTFNPKHTDVWKLSITASVIVKVVDYDGDDLSVKLTYYADSIFEQDSGWITNVTTGSSVPFIVVANHTYTAGKIKIQVRDDENQGQVQEKTFFFTVAEQGAEVGDSEEEITYPEAGAPPDEEILTPEEELEEGAPELTELNVTGNIIATSLGGFKDVTGLSVQIIFLIFVIAIMYYMWDLGSKAKYPAEYTFGAIIIAFFVAMYVGVKIGMVGAGTFIVMVILIIASLTIAVRKWFFPHT